MCCLPDVIGRTLSLIGGAYRWVCCWWIVMVRAAHGILFGMKNLNIYYTFCVHYVGLTMTQIRVETFSQSQIYLYLVKSCVRQSLFSMKNLNIYYTFLSSLYNPDDDPDKGRNTVAKAKYIYTW
jgi:hypothetical protein